MTPIGKHHAAPRGKNGSEFTQAMRYELLGEDERPLLSSYGISLTLGALWLSLVYFGPHTTSAGEGWKRIVEPPLGSLRTMPWPEPADPITISDGQSAGPRTGGGNSARQPRTPRTTGDAIVNAFQNGGANAVAAAKQLGAALGASTLSGPVGSNVLRNVTGDGGGKVAIAGAGGAGSGSGPGRSGAFGGGEGVAGGVGAVGGGRGGAGGVGRVAVVVAEPTVVMARPEIANARDVADVGQVVRSYSAQLQSCYEREGLRQNPTLAGTVTAAITISGAGRVADVDVTRRTWSGPGADDAERCIVSTIRRWRFSPSSETQGTYTFPFSFTK